MPNSKIDSAVYLVNEISATLIIPYEVVKKKGLEDPKCVIAKETDEGILIHNILNTFWEDRNNAS